MNTQSDKTTLGSRLQKNDRNARLRTILQEFKEHPNHHASPALVAALIELETELDANSSEQDQSDVCLQRSAHLMPRLQIVTEFQTLAFRGTPFLLSRVIRQKRSLNCLRPSDSSSRFPVSRNLMIFWHCFSWNG